MVGSVISERWSQMGKVWIINVGLVEGHKPSLLWEWVVRRDTRPFSFWVPVSPSGSFSSCFDLSDAIFHKASPEVKRMGTALAFYHSELWAKQISLCSTQLQASSCRKIKWADRVDMTYESFMQPVDRLAWTARTRSLLKPRLVHCCQRTSCQPSPASHGLQQSPCFSRKIYIFSFRVFVSTILFIWLNEHKAPWVRVLYPLISLCLWRPE